MQLRCRNTETCFSWQFRVDFTFSSKIVAIVKFDGDSTFESFCFFILLSTWLTDDEDVSTVGCDAAEFTVTSDDFQQLRIGKVNTWLHNKNKPPTTFVKLDGRWTLDIRRFSKFTKTTKQKQHQYIYYMISKVPDKDNQTPSTCREYYFRFRCGSFTKRTKSKSMGIYGNTSTRIQPKHHPADHISQRLLKVPDRAHKTPPTPI